MERNTYDLPDNATSVETRIEDGEIIVEYEEESEERVLIELYDSRKRLYVEPTADFEIEQRLDDETAARNFGDEECWPNSHRIHFNEDAVVEGPSTGTPNNKSKRSGFDSNWNFHSMKMTPVEI